LLVNAGGDLRAREAHDIEIRVPTADGAELRYAYRVENAALATSSLLQGPIGQASAKYSQDSKAVMTTCVLAPTAAEADALTKAVIFGSTPKWMSDSVAVLTFDDRGRALSG
jgi:thiamine biosynthesis lipoprotein ApbE